MCPQPDLHVLKPSEIEAGLYEYTWRDGHISSFGVDDDGYCEMPIELLDEMLSDSFQEGFVRG